MTAGKRQGVTRQQFLASHTCRGAEPRRETASKIVGLRRALDIRLRPWAFRPGIGLLPMGFCCATSPVVAGAIRTRKWPLSRVFVGFNRQYVRSGHYGEVCDFFWSLSGARCKMKTSASTEASIRLSVRSALPVSRATEPGQLLDVSIEQAPAFGDQLATLAGRQFCPSLLSAANRLHRSIDVSRFRPPRLHQLSSRSLNLRQFGKVRPLRAGTIAPSINNLPGELAGQAQTHPR